MKELPHHYRVTAGGQSEGDVGLSSTGLDSLTTAPPAEFGGPGNRWSPETLLVGAVADCFILTFRAIARASKLPWTSLECSTEGVLDRADGVTRFTEFHINADLTVPQGTSADMARRLLQKAESNCLITNSVTAVRHLETNVRIEG